MRPSLPTVRSKALEAHKDRIKALALSPDANILASGGYDSLITTWSAKTGDQLKTIDAGGDVFSIAITNQGSEFVAAVSINDEHFVDIYAIENGMRLMRLKGHTETIYTVAICGDDKYIASGSLDKTIRIWDKDDYSQIFVLEGHAECVRSLVFDFKSKYLFSGSYDRYINKWDLSTGQKVQTFKGHTDFVLGVDIASNNSFLVSCSKDKTIRVWDMLSEEASVVLAGHLDDVWAIKITADARYLISGGKDFTIGIWKTANWRCVRVLSAHTNGVTSLAISASSRMLYTSGMDGLVKIWYLEEMLAYDYKYTTKEFKQLLKEGNNSGIAAFVEGLIETGFEELQKLETMLIDFKNSEPTENSSYLRLMFYAYKLLECNEVNYNSSFLNLKELIEDPLFQIYLNKQVLKSTSSLSLQNKEYSVLCRMIKDKLMFPGSFHSKLIDGLITNSEDKFYSNIDVFNMLIKAPNDVAKSKLLMDYYVILVERLYSIESLCVLRKNIKSSSHKGLAAIYSCWTSSQLDFKKLMQELYGDVFSKYFKSNTKYISERFFNLFERIDLLKAFIPDLATHLALQRHQDIKNADKVLVVDFYTKKIQKVEQDSKVKLNWFVQLNTSTPPEPHIVLAYFDSLYVFMLLLFGSGSGFIKTGQIANSVTNALLKNKYFTLPTTANCI